MTVIMGWAQMWSENGLRSTKVLARMWMELSIGSEGNLTSQYADTSSSLELGNGSPEWGIEINGIPVVRDESGDHLKLLP